MAKLANKPEKSNSAVLGFLAKLQEDSSCTLRHWLKEKAEGLLPPPPE
ncbi:MAG: hypothetical protein IPN76_04000 [Saprospiraceae bacterium]|nr:hypothetical protein [Saprospiraceae bacterium]